MFTRETKIFRSSRQGYLIGTMTDLPQNRRQVSTDEARAWAENNAAKYFEASLV